MDTEGRQSKASQALIMPKSPAQEAS